MLRLLVRVASFRLQGGLLNFLFVFPYLFVVRAGRRVFRSQVSLYLRTTFVFFGRFGRAIAVVGANFRCNGFLEVFEVLFRMVGARIAAGCGVPTVVSLLPKSCVRWHDFSYSIFDGRTGALSFNGTGECVFGWSWVSREFDRIVCLWVEDRVVDD